MAHHRLDGGHQAHQPARAAKLLRHLLSAQQRHPRGGGRREDGGVDGARAATLRAAPARPGAAAGHGGRATADRRTPGSHPEGRRPAPHRGAGMARAQSSVARCSGPRAVVDDPVRGTRLAIVPEARVRAAARARRRRRLFVLLARPQPVLLLSDAAARADRGSPRAGAVGRDRAAEERARAGGRAAARQEPGRGQLRVGAGLGAFTGVEPRSFRAGGLVAGPGEVRAPHPRRHCRRRSASSPDLLSGRKEERRDAAAGRGGQAGGEVSAMAFRRRSRGIFPRVRPTIRRMCLLAGLAVSIALVLPAWAAPPAHREVLANGIRLLVAPRPAIPIVVLRAYLRAGSVFEPPDAFGVANLTAELLTRGTAKRTGPELDRAIEFVGGGLEADAGRDGTTVSLAVLKKDLDLGLDLLAEVLLTPTFPEEELRRKVEEIEGALKRSEESPEFLAGRALARLIYPGHPYAHPVTGTTESVGKLTREQVARFHREHYRPDAAA